MYVYINLSLFIATQIGLWFLFFTQDFFISSRMRDFYDMLDVYRGVFATVSVLVVRI